MPVYNNPLKGPYYEVHHEDVKAEYPPSWCARYGSEQDQAGETPVEI